MEELIKNLKDFEKQAKIKMITSAMADDHKSMGVAEGIQMVCEFVLQEIDKINKTPNGE